MKKSFLYILMTFVFAVALSFGSIGILAADKSVSSPQNSSASEGEDATVSQSFTLNPGTKADIPGYVSFSDATRVSTSIDNNQYIFGIAYKNAEMTATLPAGKYKLEVWGGSGGGIGDNITTAPSTRGSGTNNNTANATYQSYANTYGNTTWNTAGSRGGAGGYAQGTMTLTAQTVMYLYTGGAGKYGTGTAAAAGGWNGGANGSTSANGGGGGGTDIRIGGRGFEHRVIVAGGGGGSDNAGGVRGGVDDGSGGAGGGDTGEQAYIDGKLSGSYATQTSGFSFGIGQAPTTATDTGGAGGGWYGGYATNNNQGGAGGGSGYVLTSSSARPSGYAHNNTSSPYNMTDALNYSGIWNGNGQIRITMLNSHPTNKAAALGNISRTAATTIVPTAVANDSDLNISGYGEVLTFMDNKIYTDAACKNEATDYLTYSAQSSSSISFYPRKKFSSMTFYVKVKDKIGADVVASFTAAAPNFTMAAFAADGLKNNGTGIMGKSAKTGTSYPDISLINASTSWNAATDIYNPTAANRQTYMITRPLEPGQTDATKSLWNGLNSVTVNVSDLAVAKDVRGGTLLDDVFIATSSQSSNSNFSLSLSGSSGKYTSLTITPLLSSASGWFSTTLSIGLFEKSTGLELNTVAQRLSVDVVFRIGNTRPVLSQEKVITLNTSTAKTSTLKISDFISDANGNALSFYNGNNLTDIVKVPENEFYYVNKYGAKQSSSAYNIGSAGGNEIYDAFSDTQTGFEQGSIYNAAMPNDVRNTAYVQYAVDSTNNTITFTAIRATRNQYSSAVNRLGHFYILIHLTDAGDPRDTGLWYPVALQVNDGLNPEIRALDFELDAPVVNESNATVTAGQSVYIAPYYTSKFNTAGIGAVDKADYADSTKYVDNAIGMDSDEFYVDLGKAFNDFLYINADFANLDVNGGYYAKYSDYLGYYSYVKAELIPLYAPASYFSRLTADEKQAAGIKIDSNDTNIAYFNGIKLTAVTSTKDNYVEIPLYLRDTFGHTAEVRIAVKVVNRAPVARTVINDQGIASMGNKYDSTGEKEYITYTVTNLEANAFKISAYDLVHDSDVSTAGSYVEINNTDRNRNNSNPDDANNAALANKIYADSEKVYLRASATDTGVYTLLGHDRLSFVTSSLPFTGEGSTMDSYTQNRYTDQLKMFYYPGGQNSSKNGGSMDYISISPLQRSAVGAAYTFDNVQITDGKNTVTVNIAVEVVNTLPTLKNSVTNSVFYLSTNYLSDNKNSSQEGGDSVRDNYETSFSAFAYNVREFNIREIATDIDTPDLPSLQVMSMPKLGYVNAAGNFVEVAEYSDYVTVEYNTLGTGSRSNMIVTRVTAKNSTQALEHGLFIQLEVTDGFNNKSDRAFLAFQIEVLNSAPVFDATQYTPTADGLNGWELELKNKTDVTTSRYIATDKETAEILTTTGVDGNRVDSFNIKSIASDFDVLQHIVFNQKNPEMLPTAALKDVVDDGSIAVTFENPYAADANVSAGDLADTVKIIYFIKSSYNVGSVNVGDWVNIDPNNAAELATYTDKELADCLKDDEFRYAVQINPVTGFSDKGLILSVKYRDTSKEGGHTQVLTDGSLRPLPYSGKRTTTGSKIESNAAATFKLTMGTLGMNKNLVAFSNPNDEALNNKYFAYYEYKENGEVKYEAVYPSEEFYYTAIDLEKDAAGSDVAVSVPVSYLAIPNLILDNMSATIDFANSYALNNKEGSPARVDSNELTNMLSNMSLYDPATGLTWAGSEILNNPYIEIGLAGTADIESTGKYLNKNLYYSNTEENVSNGGQKLIKRDRTDALREDTFGFTLKKKNVRTNGYLELSVNLGEYAYTASSANATGAYETVKLSIRVPNNNLQLSSDKIELSTASLTANAGGTAVNFRLGTQDGIISLVNDDAAKNSLSKTNYRLFAEYDTNDYALDFAYGNGTKTYKESAYFLANSFTNNLTDSQKRRLVEGVGSYGGNVTKQMLAQYFGVSESQLSGVADGTVPTDINSGYTQFFMVSPSNRNEKNISIHSVKRISVDETAAYSYYNTAHSANVSINSTLQERKTAIEEYFSANAALKGLKADISSGNLKIYYPFKAIVFDDYEGSGWDSSSYQILEIDVYIDNSLPFVNPAMVTTENGINYYDIDIAKGETYTLRISDFFGDNDMAMNPSTRRFYKRDELTGDVVVLNTSDYFNVGNGYNTLTLTNATHREGGDETDVGIEFNGKYDVAVNLNADSKISKGDVYTGGNVDGYIRFTAINRTKEPVEFVLRFADNSGASISLTFRINISNQAPVTLTGAGGASYVQSQDIVMRTGESFTLLPTSWDKYMGALAEMGIATNNLNDDFYKTLSEVQKTAIKEKYGNDYLQFSERLYDSRTSSSAFHNFSFSEKGSEAFLNTQNFIYDSSNGGVTDKHLGYLALANDDLPWGLKFKVTNPFGVNTTAIQRVALGTMSAGSYAMAYQFRAVSSCSNVPVTLSVYDAEGKSIQFTFRITVINTPPRVTGESSDRYGLTYDESSGRYSVTMNYGESINLPINVLCTDEDASDRNALKTYRAFNGSAFSIDGVDGVSFNDYISVDDAQTQITIHCDNVFLNTSKMYTDLTFYVVDTEAKEPVSVTIRINTVYNGLEEDESASVPEFEVKSVSQYESDLTPSELALVGAPKSRSAGGYVIDRDFGANAGYDVAVYALYNVADDELTYGVSKQTALQQDDSYRLLSFDSDTAAITYNESNNEVKARLDAFKKYVSVTFAADGSAVYFLPMTSTIDEYLPLYFRLEKKVSQENMITGVNLIAGVAFDVTVSNSAPTAIGNNTVNNNYFQSGTRFLTVKGAVGYEQVYDIWNRDRVNLGLFADDDFTDGLEFVSAEVTTYVEDGEIVTPEGWQQNGNLKCAYSIEVSKDGSKLTAKIQRKVINTKNPALPYTLPVKVTVKDKSGALSSTVITFEIHNTAPEFAEHETSKYSVVDNGNEYLLELKLKYTEKAVINLEDFLIDADKSSSGSSESFSLARYDANASLSLQDLDYSVNSDLSKSHYIEDATAAGEDDKNLFGIKLINSNNLRLEVEALSKNRGMSGEAIVILRDSSMAATEKLLRLRFTVDNTSPTKTDASPIINLMGGEDDETANNAYTLIDITTYLEDINPSDTDGDTHMRIYSIIMGDVHTSEGSVLPGEETNRFTVVQPGEDNDLRQKLLITPIAGRYGTQNITVYVRDDGGDISADGSYTVSFELSISVARDYNTFSLIDQQLPYMREMKVTTEMLISSDYSLGYALTNLEISVDNPDVMSVRYEDDENGNRVFYMKALKRLSSDKRAKMLASFTVGDLSTRKEFFVQILENGQPQLLRDAEGKVIAEFTYTKKQVVIKCKDMFEDPEDDDMRFLSAASSHTFLVKPSIESDGKEMVLAFAANGTSTITINLTDATNITYTYKINVSNFNLSDLNVFLSLIQSIMINPWLYAGIALGILLLIILLLILLGVHRKKKRQQAEIEALLVSEMQLEEQMMKLAAAQTNTMNEFMLPPYSQGQDPNLLLGSGVAPTQMINPAQLPPPADDFNPDDGFDDTDF